ncbi:hypothetical protein [Curtobacterium sp. MCBD17_023]|uniref:hypothetical protein n=1 Tax=Curtobacterium sp. MCBD17_023 TaxID=2175657 RepID=UPI0011B7D5B7|nr:hypothetical protein [Curtobacterium sp. MCBD17_023]
MRGRRMWAATGAALSVLTTAACGIVPTACPAIGWTNTVVVTVSGPVGSVDAVRDVAVCTGTGCTPPAPSDPPVLPPEVAPAPSPTSTAAGTVWRLPVLMGTPDRAVVELRDAADRPLLTETVRTRWIRYGGSEQCGGPSTAEVTVRAPR